MTPQQPKMPPTSQSGLLAAIYSNAKLKDQLERMPADEKTIAFFTEDTDGFSHPSITEHSHLLGHSSSPTGEAEFSETIDLSVLPSVNKIGISQDFIPLRHVSSLGEPKQNESDYRIVGKLGAGGTGIVFQAHQRAIDREVAVKMLRPDLSASQVSRDRFLAEARVIGGLDHPNVIALHELYEDKSGRLFYSMKRIDGASWDQQIKEKSQRQNVDILLRVADGIRCAHSRDLIHRDIKPENVMLGRYGEVLLADWGLAIRYGQSQPREDEFQSIGGTPAYMAPELASGMYSQICFQTDVYLMGAILFQILTGFPPHDGKTLLACIQAAANNEIRPTEVEGELMDVAKKAMSTEIEDRYETVDQFIAAIQQQGQHDQSDRLVHRAKARIAESENADLYRTFGIADALLAEAIDMWPENTRAHQTRKKLQLELAAIATEHDDLDLALRVYEAAGEGDSDEADYVRLMRIRRDATREKISRYSTLFTHSPDAGLLLQMETTLVVEANQSFADMFGYTQDDLVDKPIGELNLWQCPQRRKELVDRLQKDGKVDALEARFLHTDGHVVDVLISSRVVEIDDEKMVISTFHNISRRKRAENDLRISRERLRDLQRLAGLATWSYDAVSGKMSWSSETFQLAGLPSEQGAPTRQQYTEMIHPDDRDALIRARRAATESGLAYELNVRQKVADGSYRQVVLRGQPILDDDGKTIEIYGVVIPV